MKYLPAKCPITPSATAQALIDKHDLVYIGKGSFTPLLPETLYGIGVDNSGQIHLDLGHWNGSSAQAHYFIARADAAKYFKARRVRKPSVVYFHAPVNPSWVGSVSDTVEKEYSSGHMYSSERLATITCAKNGIASGAYKTLTRAEFLAAIKKFGLKEDGTKIVPPAPKIDHEAENVGLKAILAAASAAVPEGYRTASDTLPKQISQMADGLKIMSEDRKVLREEVSKLKTLLAESKQKLVDFAAMF